ncbi:biotin transporter BioY [Oceanobacillus luteolus]|uniref:Biotin transporter n=1 Tax=Oceanobacillus luteolus TaxID=1274358 RepID=A0ABW4HQC3_9BACI|nr:biotin transporter BioY [Oceanobacillus luteolus]MCM3740204.1 biotin transporter BioY [Oceanobacillus luteolus]
MKQFRTLDLTFGAMFVCLMVIGANITVWFPMLAIPIGGTTVPVSLQTFFAILAGSMLGKRRGAFTIITYILVGAAGVPVFAGMQGGPFTLISPTGGFLISFVFVAFAAGYVSEKFGKDSFIGYTIAALAGLVVNYVIGVSYMYLAMNTWLNLEISYIVAWAGMIPFIIKDAALSFVAAIFMIQLIKRVPATWIKARAS